MKKDGSNGLQLILVSVVLVLTVVGGTVAWFATGTRADVDEFSVNVTSPSISSGMEAVQIKDNGIWTDYEGENLTFIPGQIMEFRVKFVATPSQMLTIKLVDINAHGSDEVAFTDENSITGQIPKICERLTYSVNDGDAIPFKNSLTFFQANASKPEILLMNQHTVLNSKLIGPSQYCYYYTIEMPAAMPVSGETNTTVNNSLDSEYMNSSISFNLQLTFA